MTVIDRGAAARRRTPEQIRSGKVDVPRLMHLENREIVFVRLPTRPAPRQVRGKRSA